MTDFIANVTFSMAHDIDIDIDLHAHDAQEEEEDSDERVVSCVTWNLAQVVMEDQGSCTDLCLHSRM